MTKYSFDNKSWPDYKTGNKNEWIITNGLGSYGSASLIGGMSRASHSLLVASLQSPSKRYAILEQMNEYIRINEHEYDLETSQKTVANNTVYSNGQKYLTDLVYDGTITYHYECGKCMAKPAVPIDASSAVSALTNNNNVENSTFVSELPEFELTKYIALKRDENTIAIGYDFINNTDHEADVVITPWLNFREENTLTPDNVPKFDILRTGDTLSLVPRVNPFVRIDFSISNGTYYDNPERINGPSELQLEREAKKDFLSSHFSPVEIGTKVPAHTRCSYSVICTVIISDIVQGMALLGQASDCFLNNRSAHKIVRATRQYYAALIDTNNTEDEHVSNLFQAADSFICKRESTGTDTIVAGLPALADIGRDTMIAFTGLTLCTKRYDDAGQLLFAYAKYQKNGLIPASLPDKHLDATYNAADTSLWFIINVYKYLKHLRADESIKDSYMKEAVSFIYRDIFPRLEEIIYCYETGTDYSIHMVGSGLISAGDGETDLSWMNTLSSSDNNARAKYGCSVEINALWYNALCIMCYLCKIFRKDYSHYEELAEKVKNNFRKAFYNDEKKCLYDTVIYDERLHDYSYRDASLTPNQLLAVSLPFELLPMKESREIVNIVGDRLYTGLGIKVRNISYTYLLGAYFSAYKKVYGSSKDGKEKLRSLYEPIWTHLETEGCIGGISQMSVKKIDSAYDLSGCSNHAVAVGEILRSYMEDVIYNS